MDIDEFNKLEEKVNNLVNSLKLLKNENKKMKHELAELKKGASQLDTERDEIRKKVTSLIELIDSIE